jgi:hypothetical protein
MGDVGGRERHLTRPSPRSKRRGWGIGRGSGRLGIGFFEGGGYFDLDGRERRGLGRRLAAEGLPRQLRGDLQGAGDLAERHFFQLAIAEAVEEAADDGGKFLCRLPLLFAVEAGAASPIGGLAGASDGLGLGVLLEKPRVELLNARSPTETAGPSLERIEFFVEVISEGGEGTIVAEVKEGDEGAERARGFAGERGEERLRVRELTVDGRGIRAAIEL